MYNRIKLYASDHQNHNFLPLTLLPQLCTFHHAKFPVCNPNQTASAALHRTAPAEQNLQTAPSRTQSTRLNPKQLPPGHQTPQTRIEHLEPSDRRRSCPILNQQAPQDSTPERPARTPGGVPKPQAPAPKSDGEDIFTRSPRRPMKQKRGEQFAQRQARFGSK